MSTSGNLILLGVGIVFMCLILCILNYMSKLKKFSYRVVFLREQNEVLVWYKSIKLQNIQKDIIKFEEKTFNINVNECNYISKNREFVYFIDYDTGNIQAFNDTTSIMSPENLEMIVSNNIVSEITKGLGKDKFDWKNFLFGVITGAFIVLMIVFILKETEEDPVNYYSLPDNLANIKIMGGLLKCL